MFSLLENSDDLYKLDPTKIDRFKTSWSVCFLFQNAVLYLGVERQFIRIVSDLW